MATTGPGKFLPQSYLKLLAADATVVIFPSDYVDYVVCPAHRFIHLLTYAIQIVEHHPGQLVLVGVRPNTPEKE
jgi:mannose-1-phosphate guanylyltransferase